MAQNRVTAAPGQVGTRTVHFRSRIRHNQLSAERSLRVKRRIDGLKQSCVAEWFEQALDRTLFE
jgi:ABC-type uncharacterized transport system auxiliary subunit